MCGVCQREGEREHLAGTLGGGDGALLQLETRVLIHHLLGALWLPRRARI